ncbi:glycoside hydrolase family 140 protein [Salinimicrobium sp. 3283s]|uniref:glycoside hydrolase family 140 protein n=1 Tax=Salinimicrobium sp. 3283s TaxID=3114359 RepID=UPI0031E534B2
MITCSVISIPFKYSKSSLLSLLPVLFLGLQLTAQQLPFLKLSEDRSYIETAGGDPFLWLGDTAWELVHRLDREEVKKYLENREVKGFTVIQSVILAEMDGLNTPNANGDKPLIDKDPTRLNEAYFKYLDFVISEAEKHGLYVGLLPAWGDKFNKRWGVGPEIFTPQNAREYGRLLGKRYKDYPNIIWILGGDRIPEKNVHFEIIRALAQGISEEDKNHLISYHPSGAKLASDFVDESWLNIDMYQSGHSSTAKEYQYSERSRNKNIKRPVINGEARYEDIPDRFWENKDFGRLDETDVRVSAYWSLLGGAAGYTYGSIDIWQMYDQGKIPSLEARLGWKTALNLPGAQQMKYLRELFSSLEWQNMVPAPELISGSNPQDEGYILASQAPDFALFYSPEGRSIEVDLQELNFLGSNAYWFNPRQGITEEILAGKSFKNGIFKPPTSGRGNDWLLVLLPDSQKFKLKKLF